MKLRELPEKAIFNINWRLLNTDWLLLLFFSIPVTLLYIFVPSTFEVSWKGRVPYIIFVWLMLLEILLSRYKLAKLDANAKPHHSTTNLVLGLTALLAPTAFTLWQFMSGGRGLIIELGRLAGAPWPAVDWPLAFEFTVFACSFTLSIWFLQNRNGLRRFKVSLFFIGAVAIFFMLDTFFHYGTVWVLQLFVPPIASTAAFFLNILGYATTTTPYADGYLLLLRKPGGHNANLFVYWPCAGVHSLIIYTFVILLFFRNAEISPKSKAAYLLVGAIGTFMVNIFRIVSIGVINADIGPEASQMFHEYYGELFFIVWTISYLIVVFLYESRRRLITHSRASD